jgi:hypothetical protein
MGPPGSLHHRKGNTGNQLENEAVPEKPCIYFIINKIKRKADDLKGQAPKEDRRRIDIGKSLILI